MQKIFLILVAVFSLASIGVGFVNRGHLIKERALKEELQNQLTSAQSLLKSNSEAVRNAKAKTEELTADNKKKEEALASETVNLDKLKSDLEDAQKQVADRDAKLSQQNNDLTAKNARITELEAKVNSTVQPASQEDDLKKQLAEKDVLTTSIQTKLKENETELASLRQHEADRKAKVMRKGLEGTILAVNPSWNFVVVSLGDRNGVIENSELLIKRGSQLIGKVRVTSVEPSTSVADIVVNSVRAGLSVQPGDKIIYSGPESEVDAKL